jgi:hypothetical protein
LIGNKQIRKDKIPNEMRLEDSNKKKMKLDINSYCLSKEEAEKEIKISGKYIYIKLNSEIEGESNLFFMNIVRIYQLILL